MSDDKTPTQLELLLAALSKAEPDNRFSTLKTFLLEEGRDLDSLRAEAQAAFAELSASDDLTDGDFAQMDVLAQISEAVANRFQTVSRLNELNGRFASASAVAVPDAPATATTEGGDGGAGTAPAAPTLAQGQAPAAPSDVKPGTAVVAAAPAAPMVTRTSLQSIPARGLKAITDDRPTITYELVAAADVSGIPAGHVIENPAQLADLAVRRMKDLTRLGPGVRSGSGLATFQKQVPDERLVGLDGDGFHQIEFAANERNLPQGNLVAAGGWCAPSEILDTWCDVESLDGLLDLPTITTRSGGVKWFRDVPFFPDVWNAAAGWAFTEDQMKLPPPPPEDASHRPLKTCTTVPCPELEECRLDAVGICVQIDLLQDRAFPTYVQRFLQRLLGAHQRRVSASILAKILAFTSVEQVTVSVGAGTPPATDNAYGPGATATILNLLELQVEHYRAKRRLPMGMTIEAVMPHWVKGVIRADLAKRNGVDLLGVTDADIARWFAIRGVRAQYIYDWQNTLIGGTTAPKVWPGNVQVLLFAAGSYVVVKQDIITLDAVYDSVTLSKNTYNYFTEEGICVLDKCYGGVLLDMPLCVDGATGGMVNPEYTNACPSA